MVWLATEMDQDDLKDPIRPKAPFSSYHEGRKASLSKSRVRRKESEGWRWYRKGAHCLAETIKLSETKTLLIRKLNVFLFPQLLPFSQSEGCRMARRLDLSMRRGKESACQCKRCRRRRFDPWIRKKPAVGNGNLPQCSSLGNPKDRGAWQAMAHGVARNLAWLSDWVHEERSEQCCLMVEQSWVNLWP